VPSAEDAQQSISARASTLKLSGLTKIQGRTHDTSTGSSMLFILHPAALMQVLQPRHL